MGYGGVTLSFRVSEKPIQVLEPHYFTKCVVSLWLGFSRFHRIKDDFARCRLCKWMWPLGDED